ncbi:MAG TPA: hypothetical protein VGV59_14700 [Pyrinomonadaceae bacterium]|nr:hypothetical protein [Pyrinomonadaceae bacterium]
MSSHCDFDYEVFISYAHLDNKPYLDAKKGWVTQFDELLDILLGEYLGSEAKIWRDNMLRNDDVFADAILMNMPRTAVMISILSPRYLKSEWCLREVEAFCKAAETSGGFRIGNKMRVYKIIKTPLRGGDPPEVFKDVLGYEFFRYKDADRDSGRPEPFGVEYGDEAKKLFLDKVGDVAYDIAGLIEMLREQAATAAAAAAQQKNAATPPPAVSLAVPALAEREERPAVYLAEATPDLNIQRDNIKRDLLQRNYRVLPEEPLPANLQDLQRAVRADLQSCALSVHLVGDDYGECPVDDNLSYVHWQNMLAAERETDPAFSRLIWMPRDTRPVEVRQRRLVKELLESSPVGGNSDLLQTSLEDFKTAIQDRLKGERRNAPRPVTLDDEDDTPLVYIVCDRPDAATVGVLADYLYSAGYRVALPEPGGDEASARADHEAKLKTCDGVLIYWHSAPKLWLLTKLDDLQKIRGYGRTKNLSGKAVYVTGEPTTEKERFRSFDALVIKNFGESSLATLESLLAPLVAQLESERGEQARENF